MADRQAHTARELCPLHGEPWVTPDAYGYRRCAFYVPELGAGEDYGCPQPDADTTEADCA